MTETKFISSTKEGLSMGAVTFLLVILVATISLFLYNTYLEKNIEDLDSTIAKREADIRELEKDEKLQAYALFDANKRFIDALDQRNKVTSFINHFSFIEETYNIKLFGFKISDGNIATNIISESDDNGLAYIKTRDFIEKYRADEENSLFSLNFINSLEGMDNIKFTVSMDVK